MECEVKARLTINWIWYRIPEGFWECQIPPPKNQNNILKQLELKQKVVLKQCYGEEEENWPGKVSMRQLNTKHILSGHLFTEF